VRRLGRWWIKVHARSFYKFWGFDKAVPMAREGAVGFKPMRWYWRRVLKQVEILRLCEKTDRFMRVYGASPLKIAEMQPLNWKPSDAAQAFGRFRRGR
jgi:hypothetical protein